MTLYFSNTLLALFGGTFLAALFSLREFFKANFLSFFGGIFLGIFVHFLNQKALSGTSNLPIFDSLAIIFILILPFCLKFKNFYFHFMVYLILGLSFGYIYANISANFKIFSGEILDTLSLKNLFFCILAFVILALVFKAINFVKFRVNRAVMITISILGIMFIFTDRIASLFLSFMQNGVILTHSWLLSIVAKITYFNLFLPFVFACFSIVLAIYFFISRPKKISRTDIVKFRQNEQLRHLAKNFLICMIILNFTICAIFVYYIKIESAPLKITDSVEVSPKNGYFEFDAKIALDNKLHRFAYVTDEGKEVRFFIINRFKDKLAPVMVFDACSICGDMGYLLKGGELICISCNVRIFLPTVGKAGGCNPIPMNYEYDGKTLKVSLKEIEDGAGFFTKTVEKTVIDPVSHKKIKNDSKFRYLYYGRTYFFENERNLAEFEDNPEKFITINGEISGVDAPSRNTDEMGTKNLQNGDKK